MKIKKSDLLKLIKEEAVRLYKKQIQESEEAVPVNSGEPVEKQEYEKNVYAEYGSELSEVVGQLREAVTRLEDMKLKQEAHGKLIPEGSGREPHYQKAKEVLDKATHALDGFAKKLNKVSIVMLKDME